MSGMLTRFLVSCAALVLFPAVAQAQGLGPLTLQSALGQPLRAEVAIVSASSKAGGLHGSIATPDAYKAMGIEFNPVLFSISVTLENRDGGSVLVLTSSRPIKEPFLDLLMVLQSAGGRVSRKYVVLFNTP